MSVCFINVSFCCNVVSFCFTLRHLILTVLLCCNYVSFFYPSLYIPFYCKYVSLFYNVLLLCCNNVSFC